MVAIMNKKIILGIIGAVVLIGGFLILKDTSGGKGSSVSASELVIPKSEVTETAKFYPYKVGNTNMEVMAVKAQDGSIRTALNTCQVCYDSGKGYYEQQGNELVCQNCRNKFKIEQIEKEKGGCNPVPIMKENKQEDGEKITISKEFLSQSKHYFENWKKL